VAAIQSYVLSQCASPIFELLWPMDVNDPDKCKLRLDTRKPTKPEAEIGALTRVARPWSIDCKSRLPYSNEYSKVERALRRSGKWNAAGGTCPGRRLG
jgi:hypothetical protein